MAFLDPHWLWIAGGILLVGIEVVLTGIFLFWVGLAAIATGLSLWVLPQSLTWQFMVFAVLGLGAILIGHGIQKRQKAEMTDVPFLNDRSKSLAGRMFVLETAISQGIGSVRIGDSVWRVAGVDMPVGSKVIVHSVEGSTLLVESADV